MPVTNDAGIAGETVMDIIDRRIRCPAAATAITRAPHRNCKSAGVAMTLVRAAPIRRPVSDDRHAALVITALVLAT